ncbi:MAG: hypothetical protein HZB98_02690 [Bacteroidia bacterium]|nr:hypothetical protein [Bacteroidia bacterium]
MMRNYTLNIAGYKIRFESADNGPDLVPSARFLRNICNDADYDVLIRVRYGAYKLPDEAIRLFHAPFVEEINGIPVHQKANFWSVWKYDKELFIKSVFPLCQDDRSAVLKFSLSTHEWDLWIDCNVKEADPLEYPLDGLLLYYLTVIYGDIFIHASGVNYNGSGYLFSGISGKGKTTMARLWESKGAKVIHDDRLILRKTGDSYRMYNTPVYNNDEPQESPLTKLFIIEHATENRSVIVKGAVAASLVMANCIQHNWGSEVIAGLLSSVATLCETIAVRKLYFKPEISIADYIIKYG